MPTEIEDRVKNVEDRLKDLEKRIADGQEKTNDRLLILDGRLARIEAIEQAQLDALKASSAWKVAAAKAIGSGVARGCESMASATG